MKDKELLNDESKLRCPKCNHVWTDSKNPAVCPKCGHTFCGRRTEVYSRIVGYYRPVKNWHRGKREEVIQRKEFKIQ